MILLTVCGNLFVVISIAHFKQLHSPTNFLILSLAIADFLLGGFIMPPSMFRSLETCWYFGDLFYRYFAVCEPLQYKTKITACVSNIMIVVSWSISAVIGFGMVFLGLNIRGIEDLYYENVDCVGGCILIQSAASSMISSMVSFYIPGFIMISIYFKIFLVARRQVRSIEGIATQTADERRKTTASQMERKAAKTLGIVMGVFLFCWMPFFLCNIIDPIFNYSVPPILFDTLTWLGYLNSTLNPLVYAFFYRWFRKALYIILFGNIFQTNSSRTKLIID
ncbi:trace amine-associated receptor 1-like [Amia ocellicauda]|uniref:trace amine-associated receptor 1-like n=1 Tax=Amia ocellicauda TaxID=2972642 RepID=UPI0034649F5C